MSAVYEFCIEGQLSAALLKTFEPIEFRIEPDQTVFRCAIGDEARLLGLVSRFEMLGLRMVSLTRTEMVTD